MCMYWLLLAVYQNKINSKLILFMSPWILQCRSNKHFYNKLSVITKFTKVVFGSFLVIKFIHYVEYLLMNPMMFIKVFFDRKIVASSCHANLKFTRGSHWDTCRCTCVHTVGPIFNVAFVWSRSYILQIFFWYIISQKSTSWSFFT